MRATRLRQVLHCVTFVAMGAFSIDVPTLRSAGLNWAMPEPVQASNTPPLPTLQIQRTDDFTITGDGSDPAWSRTDWVPLRARKGVVSAPLTRFKVLWSSTGLYVLMDGADRTLTATFAEDFADLWKEDVFEVFLWPDERDPVYFEYEISPLNRELPILVPNFDGKFLGWRPWHYDADRRVRKATSIQGGARRSGAAIKGWRAEFLVPHALLRPLRNVPPSSGTRWRANFYRMDHDDGQTIQWEWSPVGPSFHEFKTFGTLVFE
jgi:hypothetical protein